MKETWLAEVDYGPLASLIGTWKGESGVDIAPEEDGVERNEFFETLVIEEAGLVKNAEQQHLAAVRYHQSVARISTGKIIHDQVGYWLWDAEQDQVVESLVIPRGVCVLAGGWVTREDGRTVLEVSASDSDAEWTILETPFMSSNAATVAFQHRLEVEGDRMSYQQTTWVDIYGQDRFEHTDENQLTRVTA